MLLDWISILGADGHFHWHKSNQHSNNQLLCGCSESKERKKQKAKLKIRITDKISFTFLRYMENFASSRLFSAELKCSSLEVFGFLTFSYKLSFFLFFEGKLSESTCLGH